MLRPRLSLQNFSLVISDVLSFSTNFNLQALRPTLIQIHIFLDSLHLLPCQPHSMFSQRQPHRRVLEFAQFVNDNCRFRSVARERHGNELPCENGREGRLRRLRRFRGGGGSRSRRGRSGRGKGRCRDVGGMRRRIDQICSAWSVEHGWLEKSDLVFFRFEIVDK